MRTPIILSCCAVLVGGSAVIQQADGAPYPTLTREMITPCEAQFREVRNEWGRYWEARARRYDPGGEAYRSIPEVTPASHPRIFQGYADNARSYRANAARETARDPVQFYADGWSDGDGLGGGDLAIINRMMSADQIRYFRSFEESPPPDMDAYDRAFDNAQGCVARIFLAAYDSLHARTTAPAPVEEGSAPSARGGEQAAPGPVQTYVNERGEDCVTETSRTQRAAGGNHYFEHRVVLENQCGFRITVRFTETPQSEGSHRQDSWGIGPQRDGVPGTLSRQCLQNRGSLRPTGCEGISWQVVVQ